MVLASLKVYVWMGPLPVTTILRTMKFEGTGII